MFNKKHISYEFRVFAPSIFYHISEVYAFIQSTNETKSRDAGVAVPAKGGTAYGREEAEGEAGSTRIRYSACSFQTRRICCRFTMP